MLVSGRDQLHFVWISAGGGGLIDGRVKSLGDDDEERCVKRETRAAASEETGARRERGRGQEGNCHCYAFQFYCSCFSIIRPHHYAKHEMRTIVADVPWSVCVSVSRSRL